MQRRFTERRVNANVVLCVVIGHQVSIMEIVHNVINLCALFGVGVGATRV